MVSCNMIKRPRVTSIFFVHKNLLLVFLVIVTSISVYSQICNFLLSNYISFEIQTDIFMSLESI